MKCRTLRVVGPILLVALLQALLPLGTVHAGDEAIPPDGARLVGSTLVVPFHWGGKPGLYRLNVFRHDGHVVHSEVVYGNTARVPLVPGPMHLWTLETFEGRRLREVISRRTFQLSSELTYNFDGRTGPGGGDGGPGENITIRLRTVGDFVAVRVDAALSTPELLLLPASSPIVINCRGGAGGRGAPGYAGSGTLYDAEGRQSYAATAGGPGGPGGNGGVGGTVRVIANGLPWMQYVRVVNSGGPGGAGGPGGRRSRSGPSGAPGRPGPAVIVQ